MSFGNHGIGHGIQGSSRPGILGAGPSGNRRGASLSPQQGAVRRELGLLGNAPKRHHEDEETYDRRDKYADESYREQPYKRQPSGGDRFPPMPPPMPNKDRIPPKTRQIMENFGLTNSDLEELSRLPEHKLSSSNFIEMIKSLKERKTSTQSSRQQSFDDRYERAPSKEKYASYDSPPRYREERRQEDAFSSFQEKWYSDASKKNEREQQLPSSGSILRGSRGPMAKSGQWEREERHGEQHLRSPRMLEPQQRRMSLSPVRRSPPVMMSSRRMSPPPRRMSPRRITPRRSPPPPQRRHASPPVRMPKGITVRGGLLGDLRDPSSQELDMHVSSRGRNYHPRDFPEPSRHEEPPMRSRTPPPLMALPLKRKEPMLPPRPVAHPSVPRKQAPPHRPPQAPEKVAPNSDLSFPKGHATSEANIMRHEQGRVLYLRYKAGAIGTIREEHLVQLAQPFEKVTNILLMAPHNMKSGWYQAFIELADFDGAAAMLEHYMVRPPTIEGITMMVQRSKHPTLQLRKNQMNRDFEHLLDMRPEPKRRRAMSTSPDRGRKPPPRTRRDSNQDQKSPRKRSFGKSFAKERASQGRREERKSKEKKERKDSPAEKKNEKSEKEPSVEKKSERDNEKKENSKKEVSQEKNSEVQNVSMSNGAETVTSKLQNEKNIERLDIIRDNLTQAITMSEELLKLITDESSNEILSEVMEYLVDSTNQLKEIEDTIQ